MQIGEAVCVAIFVWRPGSDVAVSGVCRCIFFSLSYGLSLISRRRRDAVHERHRLIIIADAHTAFS